MNTYQNYPTPHTSKWIDFESVFESGVFLNFHTSCSLPHRRKSGPEENVFFFKAQLSSSGLTYFSKIILLSTAMCFFSFCLKVTDDTLWVSKILPIFSVLNQRVVIKLLVSWCSVWSHVLISLEWCQVRSAKPWATLLMLWGSFFTVINVLHRL